MYPDVLGAITGGARISMNELQFALGLFPQYAYLKQPLEVILILQNMVDQNMQVRVAVNLPPQDQRGHPLVVDIPRKMLTLGLRPGEVGVLRMPIVPLPPTTPGTQIPVRVAVRYRTARPGRAVRPPTGGAPPTMLSVSPFRLQVLRDVAFSAQAWNQSNEIVTAFFDIAPKTPKKMPDPPADLKPQYEALWTHEAMESEQGSVEARVEDAQRVAVGLTRTAVYPALLEAVEERFASRDLPLHPGEAMAIAKLMTYTLDEGLTHEPGFSEEDSRWFHTLCQVLAYDETVEDWDRGSLAVRYLFEAVLYDAVLLGFALIQSRVKDDLGTREERIEYANRLLMWYAGQIPADWSFVYLPLVMGGVVINELVTLKTDNPWHMLYALREAQKGRARLFTGEAVAIFDHMSRLLDRAEDTLKRSRVPPPMAR
jgi:hypothetical protein